MQNVSSATLTQFGNQQIMDYFSSPLTIPLSKLDADQYMAEDIDGVTESLFGSGNLNYLMMQAGQTNDALSATRPFALHGEGFSGEGMRITGGGASMSHAGPSHDFFAIRGEGSAAGQNAASVNASPLGAPQGGGDVPVQAFSPAAPGTGFTNGSAPTFSGGNGGLNGSGFNGAAGQDGAAGAPGDAGVPGSPGQDGSGGLDGAPGQDGSGGGDGGTTINIEVNPGDVIINLGDIIHIGDIGLGDIIINLCDLTIDLCDATAIVTNIVTNVTQTVTNITNIVTHITGDILCGVNDILDSGLTLQLDAVLGTVTGLDLSAIAGDTVLNIVDSIIDLTPVADLLEPVIDLDNLILVDIGAIFSLLNEGGHEHRPGDHDLGIGLDTFLGDLPLLNGVADIAFNPVEDLLGDIDILADLGLSLFDNDGIDNAQGDTDIRLDLGIEALDGTLLGGALDIPLDPIEAVLGDIDIDLGAATNLLGKAAENIVDSFAGGSGDATLLAQTGDMISGLADALLPGIGGQGAHDDVAADIGLGLFGQSLADLEVSEALDVIEPVTGDIDLAGGLGLDLFGDNETGNKNGDTDLDLDLDLDLLGLDIVEIDFIDIALDPLEAITGDIDIDLNMALDLLNADCDDGGVQDLLNNNSGGGGLLAWTENLLPDLGDLLGHDIDHGLGHILPAPVGDIAEGLGGLLGGGENGGLFGGGGLFG